MDDFKPNSHRFKAEQQAAPAEKKEIKPINGTARLKKKSETSKIRDIFIADDIKQVGKHIFMNMIVPTFKKALVTTLDMTLNGGNATYGSSGGAKGPDVPSYRKYWDAARDTGRSSNTVSARFDLDDIVFDTRGMAENVLDEMDNVIDRHGQISVADVYDMVRLPQPYTSNKYGWTSLRSAEVRRINDGYIIRMPKASALERR